MPDPLEKVEIKFVGDSTSLTRAIESLDKATKKLLNTQARIVDFNKKQTVSTKKNSNAMKALFIQLKANKLGFKDLELSTETLTKAFKGNKFAIAEVKRASQDLIQTSKKQRQEQNKTSGGLFDLGHSARQTSGAFSVLRSKLLLFNFAMGLGVRQLNRFGKEAAKVESMARAFNTLQGGGNRAKIAIDKLKKATDGTMSSFDLFQQANNAMILGVSDNADEMAKLFDIAQRLGHALGKDTRLSVESLVTGIGRQSKLMLDNIGIMMSATTAYQRYADANNLSADSLTDSQKKQAFLTETIKVAEQEAERLGIKIRDASTIFQQFDASVANAAVELGEAFMPIALSTAKALTALLNTFDSARIQRWGVAILGATAFFVGYKLAVNKAKIATINFNKVLKTNKIGALITLGGLAVGTILELVGAFEDSEEAIDNGTAATKRFNEEMAKTSDKERSSIEALILRLNLLSAQTPLQKELLKLGNDASEIEINLIKKIIAKEQAIKKAKLAREEEQEILNKNLDEENKKFLENARERERVGREVFGETLNFQLKELEILRDKFIKHYGETEEAEKIFQEKKKQIIENFNQENNKKELEDLRNLQEAKNEIYANNLQFQLDLLDQEFEKYKELNIKKSDIDSAYEERKKELVIQNLEENNGLYKAFEASYGTFINSLTDMDMTGQERRVQILESGKNAFISFIGEILKEKIKAIIVENVIKKTEEAGSIASAVVTGGAIAQAYAPAAAFASIATGGTAAISGGAALASTVGLAQTLAIPVAEKGGLVGGKRHSQGGTIIEAERGEFIMSRNAVQSVGLETMNKINQGEATSSVINVSINGGIVDESYVNNELIPALNKATSLGNRLNA